MNYEQIKQKKIDEAIKNKEKRYTKTELSINISWAINNANAFMPEHLKGTARGFKMIQKWYPRFIEEYRNWLLENLPLEPLTPEKVEAIAPLIEEERKPLVETQLKAIKEGKLDGIGTSGKQSEQERIEEGSKIAEITTDIAEAEDLDKLPF